MPARAANTGPRVHVSGGTNGAKLVEGARGREARTVAAVERLQLLAGLVKRLEEEEMARGDEGEARRRGASVE